MHSDKQKALIDEIFKVFPQASIVSKSKLNSLEQTESRIDGNPELAKRAKPQGTVLRTRKRKSFDSRQLSLFDEIERGGI